MSLFDGPTIVGSSKPQMIPFKVQITGKHGVCVKRVVFALSTKSALLAVLDSLPEADVCWNWPGWDVQVFEQREAFIISEGGAQ